MRTGHQIASSYRSRHGWRGDDYIDAEGYRYEKWASRGSGCRECMFAIYGSNSSSTSGPGCLIFDEKGLSREEQGQRTGFKILSGKDCDFFFKKNFSEGDTEDEDLRAEVERIAATRGLGRRSKGSSTSSSSKPSSKGGSWIWIPIILAIVYFFFA